MSGSGALTLFALSCILFSCEGEITSPAKGQQFVFVPGSTANLTWKFSDVLTSLSVRSWFFKRTVGSKAEPLAKIFGKGDPIIAKSSLSGVEIVKPATLLLKNVNWQSYNGIYQFELAGSFTPENADVRVFIAKKPIVTFNCSSYITLNEGDNFTCVCRGEGGNPPANVTWFTDGVQIGETEKENNTLILSNVDETDNGTYTCLARSYPDPMFEDSKTIVVLVKLKFKPKETTIEFTQNPAKLGTSITVKCTSGGFPEPSYTIILNGAKTVSTEKTYTISKAWWNDTGSYNCTATNERGSDWAAKFLDVTEQGPATRPATSTSKASNKITITKKSNGTVQVSLNDTSNGTEWYIVVVSVVSGIIIGLFLAYIISCSRRRWFRNRKPEPQTTEADATYQELDLSKINTEDNYQSLRVNVASNDAVNEDDSTYTQLNKGGRDDENNYQSLT